MADPGRRDGTTFTVKAKKHHWIGRTMDRRFEISAHGVGGVDAASTRPIAAPSGRSRGSRTGCRSSFPRSSPRAVLLYTLIPHKTTVPNLHGMTADAANIALQKANLKAPSQPSTEVPSKTIAYLHVVRQNSELSPGPSSKATTSRTTVKTGVTVTYGRRAAGAEPRSARPRPRRRQVLPKGLKLVLGRPKIELVEGKTKLGTIITQSPPAKTPVAEDRRSRIVVAVGSGLRTVPNVVGKRAPGPAVGADQGRGADAGARPRFPRAVNPTTVTISLQVPAALTEAEKAGSAVTIYVNPPPPPTTTKTTTYEHGPAVRRAASQARRPPRRRRR